MLNIDTILNGLYEENCYIISINNKCLIVDPGYAYNSIIKFVEEKDLEVEGVLVTHYHDDHVHCLDNVVKKFNCKVYNYKSENIENDYFKIKIIKTPGHTIDSCIFYFYEEKIIFSGDFLFRETIGIYKKEDEEVMKNSLKKIFELDKDIVVYPGHGPTTIIGYEILNNPFLRMLS